MKYLLLALASYASTYYFVGLLIRGRLVDLAEGLRHHPGAPPKAQYFREVQAHAQRARVYYSLFAGSVLTLLLCALAWWLD
ncbi:hypothetical protein ACQKPE_00460 [Pseudomonas sp. NPDC089554]|uniref:hypothetical protein n=1 Tax=Pseudomonas sp. NPDC089554 TaxID=3390653 RepID=UPI003D02ADC1